jgi:hypothetical protein
MWAICVYLDRLHPLSISMRDEESRCLGHFYRLAPPEGILTDMGDLDTMLRRHGQKLEDCRIYITDGLCIEQLLVNPHPSIRRVAKRYVEQHEQKQKEAS